MTRDFGRGNMCKGGENIRPGSNTPGQPTDEEYFVCQFEQKLQIQSIQFDVFERSIKRFGYCIALTDDCW